MSVYLSTAQRFSNQYLQVFLITVNEFEQLENTRICITNNLHCNNSGLFNEEMHL